MVGMALQLLHEGFPFRDGCHWLLEGTCASKARLNESLLVEVAGTLLVFSHKNSVSMTCQKSGIPSPLNLLCELVECIKLHSDCSKHPILSDIVQKRKSRQNTTISPDCTSLSTL